MGNGIDSTGKADTPAITTSRPWGVKATTVKFPKAEGGFREATFMDYNNGKQDVALYMALSNFSNGNKADIPPSSLYKLNERAYSTFDGRAFGEERGGAPKSPDKRLEQYDRLVKHYTDPNSEKGPAITVTEQRLFMEKWANSFEAY